MRSTQFATVASVFKVRSSFLPLGSPTKPVARRIVKENGAYLNNAKVVAEDFAPSESDFLCGKYAVLRKGKRDLAAVELID